VKVLRNLESWLSVPSRNLKRLPVKPAERLRVEKRLPIAAQVTAMTAAENVTSGMVKIARDGVRSGAIAKKSSLPYHWP
jgi:hypothetical protein